MTREQKQEFTLRISQANKTEMVVILYDIFLVYVEDAKLSLQNNQTEELHNVIKKSKETLNELMHSINPESDLAGNYRSLYGFVMRQLTKAEISGDLEILRQVQVMVVSMRNAYAEVSKKDTSPAVMGNVQSVYAGLTYGKDNLTENLDTTKNRGFLV